MVNSNPAAFEFAGDVPQSIAVAQDGAEISAPVPNNPGRRAAHAPLPTAVTNEPLWDIRVTVCAASGLGKPANFRSTVVKHRRY